MRMKHPLSPYWLVLLLVAAIAVPAALEAAQGAPQGAKKSSNTLYKRIGGYDVIAAVVDDFLGGLRNSQSLAKFAVGLADTSKRRNRQLIVDQLCELTGGPCLYIGRTMKASHEGIAITDADWDEAGKLMIAALEKNKIGPKERDEFMAVIGKLKDDIVAKKADKK